MNEFRVHSWTVNSVEAVSDCTERNAFYEQEDREWIWSTIMEVPLCIRDWVRKLFLLSRESGAECEFVKNLFAGEGEYWETVTSGKYLAMLYCICNIANLKPVWGRVCQETVGIHPIAMTTNFLLLDRVITSYCVWFLCSCKLRTCV